MRPLPVQLPMHRLIARRPERVITNWDSTRSGSRRADSADDRRFLRQDLVGDLTSVDIDFAREGERQPDAISLDGCHFDDSDWIGRIADYDFFSLAPCDDKHLKDLLPDCRAIMRVPTK